MQVPLPTRSYPLPPPPPLHSFFSTIPKVSSIFRNPERKKLLFLFTSTHWWPISLNTCFFIALHSARIELVWSLVWKRLFAPFYLMCSMSSIFPSTLLVVYLLLVRPPTLSPQICKAEKLQFFFTSMHWMIDCYLQIREAPRLQSFVWSFSVTLARIELVWSFFTVFILLDFVTCELQSFLFH